MTNTQVRIPNTEYRELPHIPGYAIGADGSFISLAKRVPLFHEGEKKPYAWQNRTEKRLKVHVADNGKGTLKYQVQPYIDGKRKHFQIARLVLEGFVRKPPKDAHKYLAWALDRRAANASANNLAWVKKSNTTFIQTEAGYLKLILKPDAELLR